MSRYEVKGSLYGRRVRIAWEDGQLSGDQLLVDFVKTDARLLEGKAVGPVGGPYTYEKHLANPLSALFLIRGQLEDAPTEFIGDIPTAPGGGQGKIY